MGCVGNSKEGKGESSGVFGVFRVVWECLGMFGVFGECLGVFGSVWSVCQTLEISRAAVVRFQEGLGGGRLTISGRASCAAGWTARAMGYT